MQPESGFPFFDLKLPRYLKVLFNNRFSYVFSLINL